MNTPRINVTPLIDVLLVLLIIFMVISPLKPSAFKARVPSERKDQPNVREHPDTLAIEVGMDSAIKLNTQPIATTTETEPLVTRLRQIFDARIANGSISETFGNDADRPTNDRIERTVFIKRRNASITAASPASLMPQSSPEHIRSACRSIDSIHKAHR